MYCTRISNYFVVKCLQLAREITDEDVARVAEMFPEMNRSDVRSVLVAKAGNAELAINELLQMSNSNSVQLTNTTNNAHC